MLVQLLKINEESAWNNEEDKEKYEGKVFYAKNKDQVKTYQIFIEPKGEHLEPAEKWKEDFLKAIRKKYEKTIFKESLGMYDILGIPFYNQLDENTFEQELFASIN